MITLVSCLQEIIISYRVLMGIRPVQKIVVFIKFNLTAVLIFG